MFHKNSIDYLIRTLERHDSNAFRELRIRSMYESADRFGSDVDRETARTSESIQHFLSAQHRESFVVGAFANCELVGTAVFVRDPLKKSRHKGDVTGVYVMPDHRGRGLARKLMDCLINKAREIDDLETLLLCVNSRATPAKTLYASLGFLSFGLEPDSMRVNGESHDEEMMRLSLIDPGAST